MKTLITITFLFLSFTLFGQSTKDIEVYVKKIDGLRTKNKLNKVPYPEMSACGGGLYGYYFDNKLVLIDATFQAELGFSSKTIYLMDTLFVKIIYREHFAEWEKYEQSYPSDKYEWDPNKMTYTDTLYTISLGSEIRFTKMAVDKIISNKIDQKLIDKLVLCGEEMKKELEEVETSR